MVLAALQDSGGIPHPQSLWQWLDDRKGDAEHRVLSPIPGGILLPHRGSRRARSAPRALDAFEDKWGEQLPMVGEMWRRRWAEISPFLRRT